MEHFAGGGGAAPVASMRQRLHPRACLSLAHGEVSFAATLARASGARGAVVMPRAFRLVIGGFPTAGRVGGLAAVLAVATFATLGSPRTALGDEPSRGLHVVSRGDIEEGIVLASDGTPWFTASHAVVHVTADGRVVRYPLPTNGEWDLAPAAWG